jgi:plasmid stabilization system protein ParE
VNLPLIIRPEAEADLAEAFAWYDAQRTGLGTEFLSEVRATLARVQEGPERYPIDLRKVRRAPVRRFPYSVYFLSQQERLLVLAVLHHRRNPELWRMRSGEE